MNITWTKQDILYLRQSKDAVSYETMAKNLGKTVCAVKNKLIRMYSDKEYDGIKTCLLYTSPRPRDGATSRMPSSA